MDATLRTALYTVILLAAAFLAAPVEAKYIGGVRPVCTPCPTCGTCSGAAPSCAAGTCQRPDNAPRNSSGTATSLSEGNLTETYAGPGIGGGSGGDLRLTLTYNSNLADGSYARILTVMGVAWTHDYNVFLFKQRSELFRFEGNGRVNKYSPISSTTYRSTEGYFETLTRTASGYTIQS